MVVVSVCNLEQFKKIKNKTNIISLYIEDINGDYLHKINIHQNIKYLFLNATIDKKIKLSCHITKLLLYCVFKLNTQIKIPQNVTHLSFNYYYTTQIKIPQNVTYLTIECGNYNNYNNNKKIKIPQNVTHLKLKQIYLKTKIIIPQHVIYLKFTCIYFSKYVLSNNVISLNFGFERIKKIKIPHNIFQLYFNDNNLFNHHNLNKVLFN